MTNFFVVNKCRALIKTFFRLRFRFFLGFRRGFKGCVLRVKLLPHIRSVEQGITIPSIAFKIGDPLAALILCEKEFVTIKPTLNNLAFFTIV